jgi:SOS-response transcriptional repressor LexA
VGLTQEKLAAKCGVSRAAVAQWEAGVTRPSLDNLVKAAEALNVWLSWLTVGDQSLPDAPSPFAPAPPRGLPVLDYARAAEWAAGSAAVALPDGLETLAADPALSPRAFALVIRDESMAPDFREGDKIILEPDVAPQPGDLVIAKLDQDAEALFRKFRPRGADAAGVPTVELVPLNADWPTFTISPDNPGRILATMVEHRRYRRRSA